MTTKTYIEDIVFLTRKLAEVSRRLDVATAEYRTAVHTAAEAALTLAGESAERAAVLRKIHDLQNRRGCHAIHANAGVQAMHDEQSADHYDAVSENLRGS